MQQRLTNERLYRILFLIAALYDFVLGLVFFIFLGYFFENIFKMPYPLYPGFFRGAAAFVIVMGIGFYYVYRAHAAAPFVALKHQLNKQIKGVIKTTPLNWTNWLSMQSITTITKSAHNSVQNQTHT